MALEQVRQAMKRIKRVWDAARTVARWGSVPAVLRWTHDPLCDGFTVYVAPDGEINVTRIIEGARMNALDRLKRAHLKLAEPGDPHGFLVKWSSRP